MKQRAVMWVPSVSPTKTKGKDDEFMVEKLGRHCMGMVN